MYHVGTGPEAERLASEIEQRKRERRAAAERVAEWKARARAAEDPIDDLCRGLDLFVSAELLALGYHRHNRSKWRKRREHPEVPS